MDEVIRPPRARLHARYDAEGLLVVQIEGELDLDSITEIEDYVDTVLDGHRGQAAVLDLAQLAFLDSTGVAVLIRIANACASVHVQHANLAVRRIIEVLGLARRLGLDRG